MLRSFSVRFILTAALTCVLLSFFVGCGRTIGKGGSPVDLYVDAVTLNQAGYPDQAIEKLDTAIDKQQDFSQAYSLKGDIFQQMQQYEKSAESYQKATELNAWSFHDFYNLGKVYQFMKKLSEAVAAYARACEIRPDHLEAHVNIAKCLNELQQYDNAMLYAQHAEQIDPNSSEVQLVLANAYQGKEDYDRAISAYKRVLESDSNDPQVMVELAIAYLKTNRDEPARELLISAIELEPQNGVAHRHLAYAYLRLYEKYASQYRELVQQGTTDTASVENLSNLSDEMVQNAIDHYTRAVEINPEDWDAHRGLGVAYIIDGKQPDGSVDPFFKDMAIEHWRRSLQINPDQPRADRLRSLIARYRTQ
jgi:tetratricopeptide (TPR) repeat protein